MDEGYSSWDGITAYYFYTCLKSDPGYDDPFANDPGPTSCSDIESQLDLAGKRTQFISDCQSGCEERRGDIINQLTVQFLEKCWVVDEGCIDDDNVITTADIAAIADSMVADCKRNYCPDANQAYTYCTELSDCWLWNQEALQFELESQFFDARFADDCERDKANMARGWNLELSIQDKCAGPDFNQQEEWTGGAAVNNCELGAPPPGGVRTSNHREVTASSTGN